jgi:gliding motility-associated-like protein
MHFKCISLLLIFILSAPKVWSQKVLFSGNDDNSIFICEDGQVYASGENKEGQLGNGTLIPSNIPVPITGIGGTGPAPKCKQVQIEGVSTFMALTNSGDTVLAWGINNHGQAGDGTTTIKTFPVRVMGVGGLGYLQNIKQIATGNYTGYALTEDGKVINWGYNLYGQLGNGSFSTDVLNPDYVLKAPGDTLKNVKTITAGGVFCMALLCDGTVWVWGRNDWGQLGQNNSTNSAYAIQVKNNPGTGPLSNIKKIEAGDNYCFALSNSDTLWTWGSNVFGQLGIGSTATRRSLPVYVRNLTASGNLSGVIDIAAGQGHSLAILSNNTVLSWGRNESGQLGNNDTINSTLPVQVLDNTGLNPLTNINHVATGDLFSIARTSGNQLYVWGGNASGELGMGDHTNLHLPALLSLPCPPASDIFPSTGIMANVSNACTGTNSGNIFINKHQMAVKCWQQSTDNFSTFSVINNTDFSVPFTNLTVPTYYRAVLTECGTDYFSPTAAVSIDPLSQSGIINSSAVVRQRYNSDTLHLSAYTGTVLKWEYSTDNFMYDTNTINNTSDFQTYSGLVKTTYYRALIKSGTCPAVYSNTVEIKIINEADVKIYDAFTPNGDNYNDEWVIDFIEHFPDNKVEIYNRWGQLVFKARHYDNVNKVFKGESNVSGSLAGPVLADGTFFYVVDLGEGYKVQKGYVVISR